MIYMMHIFETDYDGEVERDDTYLFEAPADFAWGDINMVIKFLESKGLKVKIDDVCKWIVRVYTDNNKPTSRGYSFYWLMDKESSCKQDGIGKSDFIKWLTEKYDVRELEYKEL